MPGSVAESFRGRALLLGVLVAGAPVAAHAVEVGVGDRARPALRRVAVPEPGKAGSATVAADLSGGVTEALTDDDAVHERFGARAAAVVNATSWLDFGAWLSGRYDLHPNDARGKDDGFLFQSELSTRLAFRRGGLGYGLEASAWLPGGSDVGSSFSALSADGRLLISGQGTDVVVASYLGYRLDRSAEAAGDAARLRFGDRSALGASDYDAVLAGVGVGYALGRALLFGEASAQLLLGSSQFSASPVWLSVGARKPFGPQGLSGELSLDGLLSARPDVSAAATLFPIEPRLTLNAGLRYRFGEPAPGPARSTPAPERPKPAPVVPLPVVQASSVELELLDDRGQPLPSPRPLPRRLGARPSQRYSGALATPQVPP